MASVRDDRFGQAGEVQVMMEVHSGDLRGVGRLVAGDQVPHFG